MSGDGGRRRPLLGVFMPTGMAAFSISTHPRSTVPTWEYNRTVALFAEDAGFDFLLAGARWTTLGGRMDFQGHRVESMTVITALAAVTRRVRLFPTLHTFVFHPLVAARMVNDANRVSYYEDLVRLLVPVLQQRRLLRTEYEGRTLREYMTRG